MAGTKACGERERGAWSHTVEGTRTPLSAWPEEMTAASQEAASRSTAASPRPGELSTLALGRGGRSKTPKPSTVTQPYSRSPFTITKPGSKQRMLGKDGAGSCLLTNAGNCSSGVFNEWRSARRLDSGSFRQDGDTKSEEECAPLFRPQLQTTFLSLFRHKLLLQIAGSRPAPLLETLGPYSRWRLEGFRPGRR